MKYYIALGGHLSQGWSILIVLVSEQVNNNTIIHFYCRCAQNVKKRTELTIVYLM